VHPAAVTDQNVNTPTYWDDVYRREWESGEILTRRDHGEMHDAIVAIVPRDARVLDIGCGPGILCRRIAESVVGTQVSGVDFSKYTIERNADRDAALGIQYRCVDVRIGLAELDGPFDVVTMCEILEHLDEPEEAVAAAVALVRPGGLFVLSCPHDDQVPHVEHVREWGHDQVFHLLEPYSDAVTFHPLPAPRNRWLLASLTTPDAPPARAERAPMGEVLVRLRAAAAPSYDVKLTRSRSAEERDDARRAMFDVFDRSVELRAPVDWNADNGRSWQTQLHSWVFMDVLMQSFHRGDDDGFRQGLDLALDWLRQNPRDGDSTSPLAWYDKVVGDRAPYVAYLLTAGLAAGLVSDADAELLIASYLEHGRFLADDANYTPRTNHGLYQDAGLLLLAKYGVGLFSEADEWRDTALDRFWRNFGLLCDLDDGLYLEHSTGYQFSMITLLARLIRQGLIDAVSTEPLLARMRATGAWFVTPDHSLAQIGDTDAIPAMAWAQRESEGQRGLRVFQPGGYAVVKDDRSYLAVTSSFHGVQHKHADELSFILFEHGERIVVDPGRFAYDEADPFRQFAQLSRAHNVALVDDSEFTFRREPPYGSGLIAAGEQDGWFAILGCNPLLRPQQAQHQRLFVYRPRTALVIVDRIVTAKAHTTTRLFHLASDFEADEGSSFRSRTTGQTCWVKDFSTTGADVTVVRGLEGQRIQGWEFPAERQHTPAPVVAMVSTGETLVSAISIDLTLAVNDVRWDLPSIELVVGSAGRGTKLTVQQRGTDLAIAAKRLS
jgi:SAM-dependent methyltransferase